MTDRDLVFIGDIHLDHGDPEVDEFTAFLDRLRQTTSRIVLMGDLFNLWIGRRELQQAHQDAVLGKLAELRAGGVVVHYVEGNRDFRVGAGYAGTALDEATDDGILETFGGKRLWAVHGDLVNAGDRQYRAWRRFSRSGSVWALFNLMPRASRLRFAKSLERRLRSSNPGFKRRFPDEAVRRYGSRLLAAGYDAVVLGHFHVEREMEGGQGGRIYVLPEWKGSRRHLRVDSTGEIGFVDSS